MRDVCRVLRDGWLLLVRILRVCWLCVVCCWLGLVCCVLVVVRCVLCVVCCMVAGVCCVCCVLMELFP